MKINKETIKRRSAYFVFWSWHLIYAVLVVGLIIPELSWPLMQSVITDNAPWHYVFYALLMILLPFLSIYLGAKYFRKDYRHLMQYFYGFEMPLLFFTLMRMTTFRDANAGVSWLVVNVLVALAAWFVFLWIRNKAENKEIPLPNHSLAIIGSTVLAMVGLYFGSLFLIMVFPVAIELFLNIIGGIPGFQFTDILLIFANPLIWLAVLFFLFTLTLFAALPVVMIYLYIKQFIQRIPTLLTPQNIAIVVATIAINLGGFIYFNQQPQQEVFALLDEKMQNKEAEAELLTHSNEIREGLLNAYLARYRYVSTAGISQSIHYNYKKTFGLSDEIAAVPQSAFNSLATPFLYKGEDWSEVEKAKTLYAAFFDAPIQKAERDEILSAVKHNWEQSRDNEAGLLDAANHYVHINQQHIDLKEDSGVATITVSQELENLTYQPREAVMHFSLPEDAVLTGVWLSDDKDKPKKYAYVLAPKGAAQAVYKAEVNRRVDPALLEQTGPYQYRLRVYPVPAKSTLTPHTAPLFMKFEYQTLAGNDKQWALPKLLEKRNLFWDSKTVYHINGSVINNENMDYWLPHALPAPSENSAASMLTYQEGSQNFIAVSRQPAKEHLPTKGNFALLIDGSYSMTEHRKSIQQALEKTTTSGARYTTYFCQKECSALKNNEALNNQVFFGNTQTTDHLLAFSKVAGNAYDAVFLITDEGSYELKADATTDDFQLALPLWLVHLGDALPYAYDDKVLDMTYQSQGGIVNSLHEALVRYQLSQQPVSRDCGEKSQLLSITQDKVWLQTRDPEKQCKPPYNPALRKIVAAQEINQMIRAGDLKQLEFLDHLHSLAKSEGIISHFSSMLVLVDDRQKEALKKAEEGDDRFEREIEDGSQNTTHPADPFAVPSVPEPEEWALLIIIGILLSVAVVRRRRLGSLNGF